MKLHSGFILLILFSFSFGAKHSMGQDFSLVGNWKIQQVDKYTKVGYPGAKVEKSTMEKVTGILTFQTNGEGIIESNTEILCKYNKFNWTQKTDTLMISILPGHFEGDSYHKVHFQDQDHVKIEKLFGCPRYGVGTGYDIYLEKHSDNLTFMDYDIILKDLKIHGKDSKYYQNLDFESMLYLDTIALKVFKKNDPDFLF
ncbi:MAG: hypothetical protein WCL00_08395 [Bacteroidota bacterium]